MSSQTLVQPYLFFDGNCEEALEWYKSAVGAEIEMSMRFNQSPEPLPPEMVPPGYEEKIMHATVRIGDSTILACDGCEEGSELKGFSLAISDAEEGKVRQMFDALAEGGTVNLPLEKTFWSPLFGMLTDRFGVDWMVMVRNDNAPPVT